jgi:hypothetical protein
MRAVAAALLVAAGLVTGWAAPARSQTGGPAAPPAGESAAAAHIHAADAAGGGIADVPSGPATLRGQVVRDGGSGPASGVEMLLYALPAGGTPGVRRTVTDASGRFAFTDISNDPNTSYLIGARYRGVPFPGERVAFAQGETTHEVTVHIGEPTADVGSVTDARTELRLGWRGGRLLVTETHTLENHGSQTVYVPREARAGAPPALAAPLPKGAGDFQVPLGVAPEGLVFENGVVRFYGPVYPSSWSDPAARDQGITFSYSIPAKSAGTLAVQRRFPHGARSVDVVVPVGGPVVRVAHARAEKPKETDGRKLQRWVLGRVAPGASVDLTVDVPPMRSDASSVSMDETRIFLELDDAALQVHEEHHVHVAGDTPVVAPHGRSLLALPVPAGAVDLRFDTDAFDQGLVPDDRGGALLDGPLPPGDSTVELAYQIPVHPAGGSVTFAQRFGNELPLLSIYVADTGVRLETTRLHRRRPVATTDRTYLHLEAFQVEPDETVKLTLSPIHAAATPPRAVLYALVAAAVAAALLFLAGPLRRDGAAPERIEEEIEDAARRERDAVYAALRDLEHDHETAKVADEDYAMMRHELRARAAALIEAEQTATRPEAAAAAVREPAAATEPGCPACGADARAGDRFCAQCGARLAEDARAGGAAG